MKYNAKYNRWVSKDGLVYRYDKKNDKLVLCKQSKLRNGYLRTCVSGKPYTNLVHRIVWETFKGPIPSDKVIDHINTNRTDNRLENLRCVTQKENQSNPLTREHLKISNCKPISDFGKKFKKHYGIKKSDDVNLYCKEWYWYNAHNKVCRWEVE